MRLATAILGVVLSVGLFVQAVLVNAAGGLADDEARTTAAGGGFVAAFLLLVGGAFAYGLPLVAALVFLLSGLVALTGMGDFPDLAVWAGVAFVLAVMALVAWHGKRRAERQAA